ncbi:MAG: hypothetical protein GEV08_23430 [Acidimicrobiia bacterium]|nr:hypothetical protein [Acidimicrobiia bacterium]
MHDAHRPLKPGLRRGPAWLRRAVREARVVGTALVREGSEDRVTGLAAEVAFWSVLSIVPLAIALGASLAFLEPLAGADAADEVQQRLLDWVGVALGEEGEATRAIDQLFDRPTPGVLTLGLLGAVWTSSRGFGALIRGLDVVYDLEEGRSWLGVRVAALGLTLGSLLTAALALSMLVFGPLLGSAQDVASSLGLGSSFATAWRYLRVPFALAVMVAWAATVFHVGPSHRDPWRWDLPGACATTALWLLGGAGFRAYLAVNAEGPNAVFGALGGTLTLLLFVYVLSLALLVGGELNSILAARAGVAQPRGPAHPFWRALRRPERALLRAWRRLWHRMSSRGRRRPAEGAGTARDDDRPG